MANELPKAQKGKSLLNRGCSKLTWKQKRKLKKQRKQRKAGNATSKFSLKKNRR